MELLTPLKPISRKSAFFSKGRLFDEVLEGLRRDRFYHLQQSIPENVFNAILYDLGSIIRREDVRLNVSSRLVHQPQALRFHTDQPYVDVLAWQCIEPDPEGPTLLLDGGQLLKNFGPEKLRLLKRAVVLYPNPDNLEDVNPEKLIRIEDGYLNLFFIAFRGSAKMEPQVRAAWDDFVRFVEEEGPKLALGVTLKKGECLFLHNKSFLHARPALNPTTPRFLKRIWLRSNLVKGLKAAPFFEEMRHGDAWV